MSGHYQAGGASEVLEVTTMPNNRGYTRQYSGNARNWLKAVADWSQDMERLCAQWWNKHREDYQPRWEKL